MSEFPKRPSTVLTGVIRAALIAAAVLVFAGACVIASLAVIEAAPSPTRAVIFAISSVLGGLVLAGLLIAAAAIVGMLGTLQSRAAEPPHDDVRPALERLEQSLRILNNMQNTPRVTTESASGLNIHNGSARGSQTMEQIRDLILMSEAQRKSYAEHHWDRRKRTHFEAIDRDVLIGDWVSAFARLEELEIVLPNDLQIAELRESVESEQSSRLEEDIRVARGRIRGLMSAVHWQQAEELANSLQAKYPGKAEADRLVEDIRRERESWERENMDRLFRDIAAATERRQWRQAILALEEFVRRYPLDPRAEALRLDLKTLQENAASQERKEQEELFKDLLKRQRYHESIAVARAVIQKYPHSPTATELNKLLPRVEEMARQEAARINPHAVPAGTN